MAQNYYDILQNIQYELSYLNPNKTIDIFEDIINLEEQIYKQSEEIPQNWLIPNVVLPKAHAENIWQGATVDDYQRQISHLDQCIKVASSANEKELLKQTKEQLLKKQIQFQNQVKNVTDGQQYQNQQINNYAYTNQPDYQQMTQFMEQQQCVNIQKMTDIISQFEELTDLKFNFSVDEESQENNQQLDIRRLREMSRLDKNNFSLEKRHFSLLQTKYKPHKILMNIPFNHNIQESYPKVELIIEK